MNAWWPPANNPGDLDGPHLLPGGRHKRDHDTKPFHTSCIQTPHYKQEELLNECGWESTALATTMWLPIMYTLHSAVHFIW
jgi:hypothetical protein